MRTYTIKLTENHLNVIAAALSEMPLKTALATFQELNVQVAEQSKPTPVTPPKSAAGAE